MISTVVYLLALGNPVRGTYHASQGSGFASRFQNPRLPAILDFCSTKRIIIAIWPPQHIHRKHGFTAVARESEGWLRNSAGVHSEGVPINPSRQPPESNQRGVSRSQAIHLLDRMWNLEERINHCLPFQPNSSTTPRPFTQDAQALLGGGRQCTAPSSTIRSHPPSKATSNHPKLSVIADVEEEQSTQTTASYPKERQTLASLCQNQGDIPWLSKPPKRKRTNKPPAR
jgi:hypothetical protein